MHSIIFFVPEENHMIRQLADAVSRILPNEALRACRTVDELVKILLEAKSDFNTVVLAAPTDRDLSSVLSLKNLLKSLRTIMILSDDSEATLCKALQLRPSYISTVNNDMDEVLAVLTKISQHLKKQSTGAQIAGW